MTNPSRPSALLRCIFPTGVAAAEQIETADAALLYPAEAALCAEFTPKRLDDFAAGRFCARRALAELGIEGFAVVMNPDRSPRWPPGVVGSISHTRGYRCAVAARASDVRSVGVDAECVGGVTRELDSLIFTRPELDFLTLLSEADRARAATIIFSAKEAFYKCQYVITQRWVDFQDVTVRLASPPGTNGSFTIGATNGASFLDEILQAHLQGRFAVVDDGLLVTGVTLL